MCSHYQHYAADMLNQQADVAGATMEQKKVHDMRVNNSIEAAIELLCIYIDPLA